MKFKTFKKYREYHLHHPKTSKLIFDVDGRTHYVYRISDLVSGLHYYGSRTTSNAPRKDILSYCTSSSRKNEIKENRDSFRFKIIRVFDNPAEKILYESFLHQLFDVKTNKFFWNKSNQTPFGFDTTGMTGDKCWKTGKPVSKETRQKLRDHNLGKKHSEEFKRERREFRHSLEAREKISKNHRGISGKNNPNARQYKFISPNGEEFIVDYGSKHFCKSQKLSTGRFAQFPNLPVPPPSAHNASQEVKNTTGWTRILIRHINK